VRVRDRVTAVVLKALWTQDIADNDGGPSTKRGTSWQGTWGGKDGDTTGPASVSRSPKAWERPCRVAEQKRRAGYAQARGGAALAMPFTPPRSGLQSSGPPFGGTELRECLLSNAGENQKRTRT